MLDSNIVSNPMKQWQFLSSLESDRYCRNVIIVFSFSVLISFIFLQILPTKYKGLGGPDYRWFYEPIGRSILSGRGIVTPEGTLGVAAPPGYPIVLAALFWLSGFLNVPEEMLISIFSVLVLGLASIFVYLLARTIWKPFPALLSSLLWMTCPFILRFAAQPHSEIPFILFFYGCLYLFWYSLFRRNGVWPVYFIVGVLAGIAMLIRPIAIGISFIFGTILWLVNRDNDIKLKLFLIFIILLGNFVAIFPWEMLVYNKTGRIIMLSGVGDRLTSGGSVFANRIKAWSKHISKDVSSPQDVQLLLRNLSAQSDEMQSLGDFISVMAKELRARPISVAKFILIKAAKSWGCGGRLLLLRILYYILILRGSKVTWKRGGIPKQLTISIWLIALYFWGISVWAASAFRYMIPVMGLLFILVPGSFSKRDEFLWRDEGIVK